MPTPPSDRSPRRSQTLRRAIAFLALAAAIPFASAATPACNRVFTLGLHEHGLLYESQTGRGIDKDIADEMARRSGCRIQTTLMQRARIWQLIESGALDFSLTGISTPQRETYAAFAWYVSNRYYLLVRRDARVATVRDFLREERLKVGVIRSFRYGESANRFVDALDEDQRLTFATSLDPLYQILLEDKVQGMIIEPFDYPTIEGERLRERTRIIPFDDPPVPHGLIMSRAALPADQLQAWRELIDGMRADGTMRRIFEKYFPADLAKQMTMF